LLVGKNGKSAENRTSPRNYFFESIRAAGHAAEFVIGVRLARNGFAVRAGCMTLQYAILARSGHVDDRRTAPTRR